MPIPASALEDDSNLRALVMGGAKIGKSTACISTAPGPVRVLLCEADSALKGAKRRTTNFDFERVTGWNTALKAVIEAKQDAKAGIIKTVVVDPLSELAERMMEECWAATKTHAGNEDGRAAYQLIARHLSHLINLLMTIPAHVIVISHYTETGGELIDGQIEKTGDGIVPLIPGKSRTLLSAKFTDVIWMDMKRNATTKEMERIFVTSPKGAWGPGCRSLEGRQELPADIGELIKAFKEQSKVDAAGRINGVTRATPKPTAPKPQQPTIKR
jgi:adenosyl cobinamide kinase/adenosyl cobinamide phosphate guanylyltransferase